MEGCPRKEVIVVAAVQGPQAHLQAACKAVARRLEFCQIACVCDGMGACALGVLPEEAWEVELNGWQARRSRGVSALAVVVLIAERTCSLAPCVDGLAGPRDLRNGHSHFWETSSLALLVSSLAWVCDVWKANIFVR